jgi:hypothetical protein
VSRGRWVAASALGVGVLALVAVPALWAAVLAYSAFTGCFLECTGPQPAVGVLWAGATVALLGLPVVAAAVVVRVPTRRALTVVTAAAVGVVLLGAVAQRVV